MVQSISILLLVIILPLSEVLSSSSATCSASEVHIYIKPTAVLDSSCNDSHPCLTLEQFSESDSQYSRRNISLILEFLPGNHNLSSLISIYRIAFLKLFSQAKNSSIVCTSFNLSYITRVEFLDLTFHRCGDDSTVYSLNSILSILSSNLFLRKCKFYHSKVTVITGEHCNITIYKSEFINSSRGVLVTHYCDINDTGSLYYHNSMDSRSHNNAIYYSVVLTLKWRTSNFSMCKFHKNGPLMSTEFVTIFLYMCELTKNTDKYFVLVEMIHVNATLESTHIYGNIGFVNAFYVYWSHLDMKNTTFMLNEAYIGVVLCFSSTTLNTYGDISIIGNIPWNNSASISFEDGTKSNINGKLMFKNNSGILLISSSKVKFHGETFLLSNANRFESYYYPSTLHKEGGAITCLGSTVHFFNSTTFLENYNIKNGGALSAVVSEIYAHADILIANNQAQDSGGGIYLFISHFICEISCNFSKNSAIKRGGGIYAVDSIIFLSGNESDIYLSAAITLILNFKGNRAARGGGIYFEANSEIRGPKRSSLGYKILFESNHANMEGNAIYVDDRIYLATCSQHHAQCFLQTSTSPVINSSSTRWVKITGNITNTTIFGGLLDRCLVNNAFSDNSESVSGIKHLQDVSEDQNITRMISSNPVRVCYCNGTSSGCALQTPESILRYNIQKGGQINVPVTAVDQVNRSVHASISISVSSSHSYLGNSQDNQLITSSKCTNVRFNIYSSHENETIFIFPKDQCNNKDKSKVLTLQITFENCTCPVGFHVNKQNKTSCECECDPKINPYKERCSLLSVIRNSETQGWVRYDEENGFLFHPFCPYDFCLPPNTPVDIDLHLENGSDAQCAFDRAGLLCGKCKTGYSLSFSSSRCLQCHEINWPWAFLIIVIKIIGGIVLVATILILNLTVSIGTMNGLIFYANILAADSSLFLSISKPNFRTVLIAWPNLDLGFDVCYFKGIDAYSKVWLNLLFPIYVIFVLILIILISKYSSRFGNFIGRWNPVSTLATLLLLSYTKLLRVIITALSFTIITYPTGEQKIVWLQDASVKFFGLKHFPLGLVAIAIIFVGFIYTVLLFFWQWILRLPNRRIFKWARNTRLNLFIEANLAPYKAKYRYWFGLLLFVRMALYLGIATEKSHESVTVVLAIGLIAASILLLRTFLGNNVYRNRFIDYMNSSFYYNLLALSLARLYCLNSSSCQERSSIISIALAFILFVIILSYHILNTLLEIKRFRHLIASIELILHLRRLKIRLIDDPRFKNIQESELQEAGVSVPTFTEVILSPTKDSSGSKSDGKGANEISRSADEESYHGMESEETVMNDSLSGVGENDHICKQKTHQKGKRWTDSNRLREPLLSLHD